MLSNGFSSIPITVRGDSQLVIRQLSRAWEARRGLYYEYYLRAKELCFLLLSLSGCRGS